MSDLELQYSPSSRAGGSAEPFVADYQARSALAAVSLRERIQLLPGGSQYVAAETSAPLLVYIHGGYWAALSAAESLYLAPGTLAQGWSYAAVEYTLAPTASLPVIVEQCRQALAEIATVTDASSVVLAGHSAGAHLAAMVSLVDRSPLPVDRTVLISGVFDLRPLLHTTVNDPLQLDDVAASALSPALLGVASGPTVPSEAVVAWGDQDTDAFKTQSKQYAAKLVSGGVGVTAMECRGRHHFDIVDDLVDPSTNLGTKALAR